MNNPIWKKAARSWHVSQGMEEAAIIKNLQSKVYGFGLDVVTAKAVAAEVVAEYKAEQDASAPRRAIEQEATTEWYAAVKAAQVLTPVLDAEGVWITEMRVPRDWTYQGCRTLAEFKALKCANL